MTINKTHRRRHLLGILCVILILSAFFVPTALATDVHVTSAWQSFMYFECNEPGYWKDLGTPPHYVIETGQPAYCLQMSMDSPLGEGYYATDGSQYYNPTILNGLKAILAHGYPASNGGFTDNEAQFATANAIRFFLAENGIPEMPAFLRDTNNCRGKPGYEALFNWCLELLEYGRHPDAGGSISFSSSDMTLVSQDYSFVGDVVVSCSGVSSGYSLDTSGLPDGTSITGYTGNSGDTLHISIPEENENAAFTLSASGTYSGNDAVLFFYSPNNANQQRVVTSVISFQSTPVNAAMTIRTPSAPVRTGSIELSKVDEAGNPVQGCVFALYNSSQQAILDGVTDERGICRFDDLFLGDYYYAETATLPHLVLDPTLYPVTITEGGQTVTKTAVNEFARGNIRLRKVDEETGAALSDVHFVLRDSNNTIVAEGDTGADGTLSFNGLLLGSYTLQETATLVNYVLNPTLIPVDVTEHGQTYEITRSNELIRGNLEIIKKDKYENTPLAGAGFWVFDSAGTEITAGYTDAEGKLTFTDLLYGDYTVQEFRAPKGYIRDETIYPFSITEHGVTITHTAENERRPGTIEVKKQDASGNPFPGVAFLLEYSTDNGTSWQPVTAREGNNVTAGGCTSPGLADGQLVTDASGRVTFTGLRADSAILYRLIETKAPEGCTLISGPLYVGALPIESDNPTAADAELFDGKVFVYTLLVTATDDPTFRLPETGGSGFEALSLSMLLCAAPIPLITKNSKRKGDYV